MKTIKRKSLLYPSGVDYGEFSLNYVEGCSHGCKFPCYAMSQKIRFGKIKGYNDWIKPKIVENALELMEKELTKLKDKVELVNLCFSTDPFMHRQKDVKKLTLKIISMLNENGIKAVTLTKGIYPKVLADKTYSSKNEYGITLVSLNTEFQKKFEPGAAPVNERLESLRYLHDRGLKTWVSIEPYPTPNIVNQDLVKILEKMKFVDKIVFGSWNYNRLVSRYPNAKKFYLGCAETLSRFCKKNGIEFHVKIKGQELDRFRNAKIFEN
jgi:DNA repair photolyase